MRHLSRGVRCRRGAPARAGVRALLPRWVRRAVAARERHLPRVPRLASAVAGHHAARRGRASRRARTVTHVAMAASVCVQRAIVPS
jgi:hypothetical protein